MNNEETTTLLISEEKLDELLESLAELVEENQKLEKALDKLSATLQGVDGLSAKEWKEWSMRGVSEGYEDET